LLFLGTAKIKTISKLSKNYASFIENTRNETPVKLIIKSINYQKKSNNLLNNL